MKKNILAFCGGFLALLMLGGVCIFALPQRTFSENENRYLQTTPALTLSDALSGQFQSKLTDCCADQFPCRDFFTGVSTVLQKTLGKKDIDGVYLAKDGYYPEKVLDRDIDLTRYQRNVEQVKAFAEAHPDLNTHLLLAPTACSVLTDLLPRYASVYDAETLENMAADSLGDRYIGGQRESFAASKQQLYYRTDHHWTLDGAYLGYRAYCDAAGLTPTPWEDFCFTQVSRDFRGTLYSKVLDPAAGTDSVLLPTAVEAVSVTADGQSLGSLYDLTALEKKDQYQVYLGGNHGTVVIETGAQTGRSLLLIKDSFANCFAPLLTEQFDRIVLVDLRYFSGALQLLIEENRITDALFLYEMHNFAADAELVKLAMY